VPIRGLVAIPGSAAAAPEYPKDLGRQPVGVADVWMRGQDFGSRLLQASR